MKVTIRLNWFCHCPNSGKIADIGVEEVETRRKEIFFKFFKVCIISLCIMWTFLIFCTDVCFDMGHVFNPAMPTMQPARGYKNWKPQPTEQDHHCFSHAPEFPRTRTVDVKSQASCSYRRCPLLGILEKKQQHSFKALFALNFRTGGHIHHLYTVYSCCSKSHR